MLPKPEKNKKNISNSEQLDLVESLSHEKKTENKRRYVLVFLIVTVGLSVSFWTYRAIKNFNTKNYFSKISFYSIPKSFTDVFKTKQNGLNLNFDNIISRDSSDWSIFIYSQSHENKNHTYQKNMVTCPSGDPELLINDLIQTPVSQQSILVSSLPQGTQIREKYDVQSDSYNYESLVSVPNQKILFCFKISGKNLEASKKLIPLIVEDAYWHLMSLNR